ncbi:MAG: hypothetical protein K2Q22_00550 [Cytophagales bacterium]|nr:hypothetical protein [Cytophagales bacterium]
MMLRIKIFLISCLIGLIASEVRSQTAVIPDPGFLARLKLRYPSLLNSNNELIIARAATITGRMTCNNCGIKSLEGIQYFTSLNELNFPQNSISYIPDISGLQNLVTFTVNDNLLTALPDFSKLKKLKYVTAHRNKITYIPDLSSNDSLVSLYIHSNFLDTLPNLSNLKRLTLLHLFNNKLKSIPGLENLVSLRNLYIYYNQFNRLPSLENLPNLTDVRANNNLLTEVPAFAPHNKIKTLRFENNRISKLPDFTLFDSLVQVRLQGNYLTFNQLEKITVVPNYSSIFMISPQSGIKTGKMISIKVEDVYTLRTQVDTTVAGVKYIWFKNGQVIDTVSNDSFTFTKTNFSDSGKYYCNLRLESLPELTLQTDTFTLTVNPCVNVKTITHTVFGADCNNSGIVQVSSNPALDAGSTFSIKGGTSGKEYLSAEGKFVDLLEPTYTLKIISANGCETAYPVSITVPIKPCSDVLITPDNDGNMDTYFFSGKGPVKIYDKRGYLIKTLTAPTEWDCTSDKGKVPVGYYMADINNGESKLGLSIIY